MELDTLPSVQPDLDAAKVAYLRAFCDRFYPELADRALSQHDDNAINLLIFSARKELQTPKPTENSVQDYWQAMLALAPTLETPAVSG